ncbi:MAG: GNAT family N-acetyltransferase [Microthrixaceae bacterium]|nr:GNAT family N-acetyltransferase [Microthrixaceae bacterium]
MTDGPAAPRLRSLAESDLDEVLQLNQRWVPHVGSLRFDSLAELVDLAELAVGAFADGELAGFVVVLGPGAGYASPNYRYFSGRHRLFTYVDRIAIAPRAQGTGLGRVLYEGVVDHARGVGSPVVCAEVNLDPPNPGSQAFHERLGFVEVGRQWTYDDTVQVQMLELVL